MLDTAHKGSYALGLLSLIHSGPYGSDVETAADPASPQTVSGEKVAQRAPRA